MFITVLLIVGNIFVEQISRIYSSCITEAFSQETTNAEDTNYLDFTQR